MIIHDPVGIDDVWHRTVVTVGVCQLQRKRTDGAGEEAGREGAFHSRQHPKEASTVPQLLYIHLPPASAVLCVPNVREHKP